MQTTPIVRQLQLAGIIVGFLLFAVTTARWFQHVADVEAVHHSPLFAHVTR